MVMDSKFRMGRTSGCCFAGLLGWVLAMGLVCHSPRAQDGADPADPTPTPAPPPVAKLVFVIPIEGEVEKSLYLIVVRALRQARRQGADAVVLDMDTPGGRVDSAIKIRDALIRNKIPTYTYVNPMAISAGAFIALATDKIIMGENGSIGGALPITVSRGEADAADEKFQSVFNAEMRKTAETKGHPVDIAEGFSNPDLEIPGIKEKGKILTLTYSEATSVGLAAYQALTLKEMLDREGLGDAFVERFEITPTDRFARFLSSSAILGILMMVGLGGLFLEIKTPGVGLPGAIGAGALILAFFGSYLANLSGYMEWIFFILGVVLLVVEIYIIPGIGVAGLLGIVFIVGSLFFTLMNLSPDAPFSFSPPRLDMIKSALITMIAVLVGLVPFLYVIGRVLRSTPLYDRMVLDPAQAGVHAELPSEERPPPEEPLQRGERGRAITDLHPTGTAEFGGRRLDVLTEGDFVDRGKPLIVLRVEGSRVFVHEAADAGTHDPSAG